MNIQSNEARAKWRMWEEGGISFAVKAVKRIMERLSDQKLNPNTRAALEKVMTSDAVAIEQEFNRAIHDELEKLIEREIAVEDAKEILKNGERYPDPRVRQAMEMYHEIVDGEAEEARRNAILSAGRIVASYFGGSMEDGL